MEMGPLPEALIEKIRKGSMMGAVYGAVRILEKPAGEQPSRRIDVRGLDAAAGRVRILPLLQPFDGGKGPHSVVPLPEGFILFIAGQKVPVLIRRRQAKVY